MSTETAIRFARAVADELLRVEVELKQRGYGFTSRREMLVAYLNAVTTESGALQEAASPEDSEVGA